MTERWSTPLACRRRRKPDVQEAVPALPGGATPCHTRSDQPTGLTSLDLDKADLAKFLRWVDPAWFPLCPIQLIEHLQAAGAPRSVLESELGRCSPFRVRHSLLRPRSGGQRITPTSRAAASGPDHDHPRRTNQARRLGAPMADEPYAITSNCLDVTDKACVDVRPVQCIYGLDGDQLVARYGDGDTATTTTARRPAIPVRRPHALHQPRRMHVARCPSAPSMTSSRPPKSATRNGVHRRQPVHLRQRVMNPPER